MAFFVVWVNTCVPHNRYCKDLIKTLLLISMAIKFEFEIKSLRNKALINIRRCKIISEQLINEQIRAKEVRLVAEDGTQLGVVPLSVALQKAEESGEDLVLIAPTANPPVCKIIDYGKYRYEIARKDKEAKKKQKVIEVKEVRLSPNIDTNDLNTKVGAARKFLEKGNKVKVTLRFRGREMTRMNLSKYILDDFAKELSDIAVVDRPSKAEGRSLIMFLSAKKA